MRLDEELVWMRPTKWVDFIAGLGSIEQLEEEVKAHRTRQREGPPAMGKIMGGSGCRGNSRFGGGESILRRLPRFLGR
jgi:hypothetical protein